MATGDVSDEVRTLLLESAGRPGTLSTAGGHPGKDTMDSCSDIVLKATQHVMEQDADYVARALHYGNEQGDVEYLEQLAQFLSKEYGDTVVSSNLMATSGATQALNMIVNLLFDTGTVIFTEDPTYFLAWKSLRKDLRMQLIPVACNADGIDVDALDALLTQHRPRDLQLTSSRPFWTMVYTIPVFHNPTTRCSSPDNCRRLVELARKHDVLLVAEDIYNVFRFGEAPPRLLTYDRPGDGQGWGHTLSLGTFSKILAPGLRLGWVEGPEPVLRLLYNSYFIWSGGSPNQYGSKLVAAAIRMGLIAKHVAHSRRLYKEKSEAACKVLQEHLPGGSTFVTPKGGFFIWIEFPKDVDTLEMMKWLIPNYKVVIMPGIVSSVTGEIKNCVRLSTGQLPKDQLVEATTRLCKGASEFIRLQQARE